MTEFCGWKYRKVSPGHFVDVSAFNTVDYLRNTAKFHFDKYRYFTDKVAEKAKDLAILHSCISHESGRSEIKQRFISLGNNKYRDYALRLAEMIRATPDLDRKAKLLEKFEERKNQIRRLVAIWKKYAWMN